MSWEEPLNAQRKFKLALFDWNGTLLDDLDIVYGSVVEIFRRYGLPAPTLEQYRNEIEADFMKFYYEHGMHQHVTGNDLNAIRKQFLLSHPAQPKLRPDALKLFALCQELKIPMGIVSASKMDLLMAQLKQFEILNFFDDIQGSAFDKEKALVGVLDQFGVPAEEVFYLDDSVDGLTAAKNLGITTIGVTNGYYTKERIMGVRPDYPNTQFPSVDSLETVIEIIVAKQEL